MLTNTPTRYGAAARFFHWAIALLILFDLALGLIGEATPRNADTVARLQTIYSVHKTLGVTVLFLAILRVIWAMTQPKPVPLHPDRKAETHLAEFVHWALYGAIFVMPLSGWITHAAESGFAPILWPFGQGLPFVPKSESVAHAAGAVHGLSAWIIYITVGLHVAGALKHAIIDRDGLLARMLKGRDAGEAGGRVHASRVIPLAAVLLWGAGIAMPLTLPEPPEPTVETEEVEREASVVPETSPEMQSDLPIWTVEEGSLGITVAQMGAPVEGSFANWNAQIAYDPKSGAGEVSVMIDTTSLSLGTVTEQAKGPEFFNTGAFASATFAGDITRVDGTAHEAVGTLTLVGQEVPVTLTFDLTIDGDTATMVGATSLDRRDYGIGSGYEDESTVGYSVEVATALTATLQ
ncbi:cytochrome b/b6 domain-containing protein [Celeribacter litoreus]|uniref:cytochrome b/b6 domain-containing protein n=1 Tax=Celeribacter litoreus TaxID=2876714 RepID=UPI001CCC19D7|nr:cytochrome b/b6 domain-containing protein [Celeribacter litoreus]MCA0042821.1 cytochrome b/b6 domain-containing protein [Celeribacter litoreus]